MEDNNITRDNYKSVEASDYEDWPTESGICGSSYLDLFQIEFAIEDSKKRLDDLTEHSAILQGKEKDS